MDLGEELDANVSKIRETLNRDKIKLWLLPYYDEKSGSCSNEIQNLACKYSDELVLSVVICQKCITTLQDKSLSNLKEKREYESTGVAVIKIKIPNKHGPCRDININMQLASTGVLLKQAIAGQIDADANRLKLISKGKVVKDSETLEEQGVKHGSSVLCLVLPDSKDCAGTSESHAQLLNSTIADIELLNKQMDSDLGDNYMEVTDQSGRPLELPKEERKALTLALTLNEKGRAALKKENYTLALVMLLEADKQFSQCNSDILKSVDNYGLINLDIAWCYLNLQSLTQLPDAETRLKQCEKTFTQSYGVDFERLIALKGSAGNERALLMRLHLLQGVIAYHQNKTDMSRTLLQRAGDELKDLVVDDNQLSQLVELGYRPAESRIALRAARGDINAAVNIIESKREERTKNAMEMKKKRDIIKEKQNLGKCLNGTWVEPQFHKALVGMGYSFNAAKWALQNTNNNIADCVNLIQQHPELLPKEKSSDEDITQICRMGFSTSMAKLALKKHNNDIQKAVDELVLNEGVILGVQEDLDSDEPGPSVKDSKRQKKQQEAFNRLADGIEGDEDDHLDLMLVSEAAFLTKYKKLVGL